MLLRLCKNSLRFAAAWETSENLLLIYFQSNSISAVGLEAKTYEAEATTHEAEARIFGLEAESRPRGLTSRYTIHTHWCITWMRKGGVIHGDAWISKNFHIHFSAITSDGTNSYTNTMNSRIQSSKKLVCGSEFMWSVEKYVRGIYQRPDKPTAINVNTSLASLLLFSTCPT